MRSSNEKDVLSNGYVLTLVNQSILALNGWAMLYLIHHKGINSLLDIFLLGKKVDGAIRAPS